MKKFGAYSESFTKKLIKENKIKNSIPNSIYIYEGVGLDEKLDIPVNFADNAKSIDDFIKKIEKAVEDGRMDKYPDSKFHELGKIKYHINLNKKSLEEILSPPNFTN